jgi:hypothetical protein
MEKLIRVILSVLFGLLSATALSAQESRPSSAASESALPSLDAIKSCINQPNSPECLDMLFRDALKKNTTLEVLQLIQRYEKEDIDLRRDCHPVVHAIGRETYRIKGTIHDSFSACDQTCQSGCYHGSVERFLRGEDIYAEASRHPSAAELKQKAALACDLKLADRFRFQCLHGLGHALLFFNRYQLASTLEACDGLPNDWSQSACYGGVFMENVSNATPELRDLSPTDYHYPCDKLASKYRSECYVMQTSRMSEMGLSTERIFQECDKSGEYHFQCALSVGRDLSNYVRLGQIQPTAQKCQAPGGESKRACIRGVVYALIDNTWDGRYAMPFCAALSDGSDQTDCYRESIAYLKGTFEKTAADIAKDCRQLVNPSERCVELAGR